MHMYLMACICAFLAVLLATAVLERWAPTLGLVDHPGGRKTHVGSTPCVGGLGIALALILAQIAFPEYSLGWEFWVAASIIVVIGALDDIFDVHWSIRLALQVFSAFMLVKLTGVQANHVGEMLLIGPKIPDAWAIPLSVVAIVGIMNAVNMSDGIDGLAGSQMLVASGLVSVAAFYAGNLTLASAMGLATVAILAFLIFNFPVGDRRARVFLGDSGSMLVGLMFAWAVLRLSQNTSHPVSPVLPLWFAAPVIIDCLVLIIRRLKLGRSPFKGGRDHIHHLLQDAGWSPLAIVVTLMGLSGLSGLGAALALRLDLLTENGLLAAFFILLAAYYFVTSRRERAVRLYAALRPRVSLALDARSQRVREHEPIQAEISNNRQD